MQIRNYITNLKQQYLLNGLWGRFTVTGPPEFFREPEYHPTGILRLRSTCHTSFARPSWFVSRRGNEGSGWGYKLSLALVGHALTRIPSFRSFALPPSFASRRGVGEWVAATRPGSKDKQKQTRTLNLGLLTDQNSSKSSRLSKLSSRIVGVTMGTLAAVANSGGEFSSLA